MSRSSATDGVLLTRLLPPRLPPTCLPRPGLIARVVDGLAGRGVLVAAGAGYGKTTLLVQSLAAQRAPWVWLSCDERLVSTRLLLAHVGAGLARRFPGVGARLVFEGPDAEQVGELCNEIVATVSDDFVLALDDVHALAGTPGADALELLVRDLPPHVHLALASRTAHPVPLARLRAAGALEVGESDLALTAEETGRLARSTGRELSDAEVAGLHQRTEGWVAGLLLAARAEGPLDAAGPPDRATFDYLAEEVFAREPPETRALLMDLAVLERFTPELAAAVSGHADARTRVEHLVGAHLFTIRLQASGEWFRFHHLFQDFLRRQLAARPGAAAALHRRAAEAWREAGEPAEAVRHLLAAGDPGAAAAVLEPIAEGLLAAGEGPSVASWLAEIPRTHWTGRPGLRLASSTVLFNRGEFHAALDEVAPAVEELISAGDHERAATALFWRLHFIATVGGAQERGIEEGRRHLPRIDPDSRMLPIARIRMAAIYAYANRHRELEEELAAAAALPAVGRSSVLPAYAATAYAFYLDHPRGRSERALATLDESIARLERNAADDVLRYLPYVRAYRGVVLNDVGRYEETLLEAERVVEATEHRQMARMGASAVAWMRYGALAGLERWDELRAELTRTAPLFEGPGGAVRGYHYPLAAAKLAAQAGDGAAGLARVASARAALRSHGYAYEEAQGLSDLALAAHRLGDGAGARELARDAHAAARVAEAPRAQARAAMVGASVAVDAASADALTGEALELTVAGGFAELWTRKERRLAGPLLARALARRLGPPGAVRDLLVAGGGDVLADAVERLGDADPAVRAELAALAGDAVDVGVDTVGRLARDADPYVREAARASRARLSSRPRAPVHLHTLGDFWVARAGVRVADAEFGRRKARALLAALACAGGAVHRDRLVDWLWPDLPADRGLAALHTTLHALRRTLEPGLERGGTSSLVVADGPTYRLVLGADDAWDAADFVRLAREAGRAGAAGAVERLEAAEAAYGGAFLSEWTYEAWAQECRDEVERAHLAVLSRLAERLMAAGRAEAAIGRAQRLVGLQPEREGWHRLLMRAYAAAGERALALRQFHDCRARLRRELGLDPGEETRALYLSILGREPGRGPAPGRGLSGGS